MRGVSRNPGKKGVSYKYSAPETARVLKKEWIRRKNNEQAERKREHRKSIAKWRERVAHI